MESAPVIGRIPVRDVRPAVEYGRRPAKAVAGETFEVPIDTPHQMASEGPARLKWEVRPALRTAEFFETIYSGSGGADFLEEFKDEFRLTKT